VAGRVALALGSGGARGFAHIGVIEVLGERGLEIVAVAGSSIGALVGGVMAAGRLEEFTEWVVGLKQRDVLRLFDPRWSSPGMITADRLIDQLGGFLGDTLIEDLPIPYTAVATDISARREVWFQRGSLRSAIRASIAIPGLITPVLADGRVLADGGLLNPVPIEPTASAPADLTVAVSLLARRSDHETAAPIRTAADGRRSGSLRLAEVITSSLDAMQDMIARYRMAGLPPDVHIAVPVSAGRVMDFHRAAEMISLGRDLAIKALDDAGL
jgi:NTE family protein